MNEFRLMSYNIHKGKSFFTRKRVFQEIKDLITDINADIVFLQEVRDYHEKDFLVYGKNQLEFLLSSGYQALYGKNAEYEKGHHGNAILTKYPIIESQNFSLTVSKMEQRGVLYNKLSVSGQELYTFCTHLNLRKPDRQKQIYLLEKIIEQVLPNKQSNILLVGDFNDFDNSIERYFQSQNYNVIGKQNTFPNFFPLLSPDKVFAKNMKIKSSIVLKNKSLIKLSDHLPIVSELALTERIE